MANIHILDMNKHRLKVVFHIPVPDIDNRANINYRDAVVKSGHASTSILADAADPDNPQGWEISSAEKDALASGALIEHVEQIPVMSNDWDDLSVLRTKVLNAYNDVKARLLSRIQKSLRFWGLSQEI